MSFFRKIGQFFVGLFNAAKKAFNKLSTEQQEALTTGTGIVEFINTHLDETPANLRRILQIQFPNLTISVWETTLFEAAKLLGLKEQFDTLEEIIGAIQEKLKKSDGQVWAIVSHTLATAIALFLSPKQTKVSQVVTVIEWVYQVLFKNKK